MATTNIWKKFQTLLPSQSLIIGEVVSIEGTRSKIRLRDESEIMVNGASVAVGSKAQVINGAIQAEAKDLVVTGVTV